jgi:hypothetical protein
MNRANARTGAIGGVVNKAVVSIVPEGTSVAEAARAADRIAGADPAGVFVGTTAPDDRTVVNHPRHLRK